MTHVWKTIVEIAFVAEMTSNVKIAKFNGKTKFPYQALTILTFLKNQ